MNLFNRFFGKRPPIGSDQVKTTEQAVLVYLDGVSLPDEVYKNYDLATLEEKLGEVLEKEGLGEYDGNQFGKTGTVLYMYGRNAEALFTGIESTLRDYPLCTNARVVTRHGSPGTSQRELRL